MMDQDTFDADVEDAALTSPTHQAEKVKGKGSKHPRMKRSNVSISSLEDEDTKPATHAARRTKSGASKKSRESKNKSSSTTTSGSTTGSKPSAADVASMAEAVARTLSTCEWDDNLLVLGTKELNAFLKQGDFTKEQMHRLKVARRRAKNRTYALRSRQKKSGKTQSPCPGPSPMATADKGAAATEESSVGGKKQSHESGPSPLAASTTLNESPFTASESVGVSSGAGRPVVDIIGSTLAAAGGVIDDDDSASEFEYNLGAPGSLPWSFPEEDDDLSSILSSDTDSLSGSTSTFDGFSTDSFATDDYDSSIDLLSSSLDRSQTSNAAFASAAFDRFEALSINAAEQEYQADLGDNFLRCMFANNVTPAGQPSLTRSGTVSGMNGSTSVPMDVSGLLGGGRARANTHAGVGTGGPMQQNPEGLVSELDAMMADLREGYSAVHRKIDSMASMLQAPEVVASGGGAAAGSVHSSTNATAGAGLTLTLPHSDHSNGTGSGTGSGTGGGDLRTGLPGGGIVGLSLPTAEDDGTVSMVDVPPHTPTLASMATAAGVGPGPSTPGPGTAHNKQHVAVATAAATAGAARQRRRSRSTTPTPADGVNVAHLPASLDVVNTIRELKSGFNNLNSKIDAWTHQAGFPSSAFPSMNLSPDGLSLSPGMGGLASTAFSFDMDVDPDLPKPMQ
eukprot:m.778927 g.778927  ORF g.778927 m.778927 type:complete len:679 (+) comp23275_c0_seq2:379-2415(+)